MEHAITDLVLACAVHGMIGMDVVAHLGWGVPAGT
jgi:hypothetical protein